MIKVNYEEKDNKIINLTVTGHANSAEYGKDLVCSAVSAIVVGALNALNDANFKITLKEGLVEVKAIKTIDEHDNVVLKTVLVQLRGVEETNSKFIQIKRKE